jgi:hypothetical protein
MKYRSLAFSLVLSLLAGFTLHTQAFAATTKDKKVQVDTLKSDLFSGLQWRGIGPAFTSGRIADFAVNPCNTSEYYVAVASGHIWKTVNNGTTFQPVFDNYGAY